VVKRFLPTQKIRGLNPFSHKNNFFTYYNLIANARRKTKVTDPEMPNIKNLISDSSRLKTFQAVILLTQMNS